MQLPIDTGLVYDAMFGRWTNASKQPFAGTIEQKHEAPTECPRKLSPLCSAQYEEEPVSVHRAAERGVDR